jgi:hypothetical protein
MWDGKEAPTDADIDAIFAEARERKGRRSGGVNTGGQNAATPKKNLSWGDVASRAVHNIPQSGAGFIEGVAHPFLHPSNTVDALRDITFGGLNKFVPGAGVEGQEAKFDALVNFFKQRYGGVENAKNTLAEDPVGALADVSTLFTGGGAAAGTAPARLAAVAKAAEMMRKAGRYTDPLNMAVTGAGKVIGGTANRVVAPMVGQLTGAGAEPIRTAFSGGKDFRNAMRGKTTSQDILGNAKDALGEIKMERGQTYLSRLNELKQSGVTLDFAPIRSKLDNLMSNYNIKRLGNGELDFSRSTLDKNAVNDMERIIKQVDGWGTQQGDLSPAGFDVLKRQLDDFYSPNKNSRAFVTSLRNEVKREITRNVPEYAVMTKDYELASGVINEMERALSMGNRASADTAIRKLTQSLKDNQGFRRSLIEKMDAYGTGKLKDQISGNVMSAAMPQSALGRYFDLGIGSSLFFGANPKIAALAAISSPRVVGELTNAIGRIYKLSGKFRAGIPKGTSQAAFQTGRVAIEAEREK